MPEINRGSFFDRGNGFRTFSLVVFVLLVISTCCEGEQSVVKTESAKIEIRKIVPSGVPVNISYFDSSDGRRWRRLTVDVNQFYLFSCVSQNVVRWDISNPGYTHYGKDNVKMARCIRGPWNDAENSFQNSIFNLTVEFYSDLGTSGRFICRDAGDGRILDQIHVFTASGNFFSESGKNVTGFVSAGDLNEDSRMQIIPCPSNFPPTSNVIRHFLKLLVKENGLFRLLGTADEILYQPEDGFLLAVNQFKVVPGMEFQCQAQRRGDPELETVSIIFESPRKTPSAGRGSLTVLERGDNSTISWDIPGHTPSVFCELNNAVPGQKLSDFPLILRSFRCNNPFDCDLTRQCLTKSCPEKTLTGVECDDGNCKVILHTHFTGILNCQQGNKEMEQNQFLGLNARRYLTSDPNIPIRALIRMDEVAPVLYSDESALFFCEASSFLFAKELQFLVEYSNGSKSSLDPSTPVRFVDLDKEKEDRRNIGTIQRAISMNLTDDSRAIFCLAPWFNSTTAWLNTSRQFQVQRAAAPVISKLNLVRTFYDGDADHTLVCFTNVPGQPPPIFKWTFNNTEITRKDPNYRLSTSNDGRASTLTFPTIRPMSELVGGKYQCTATNRVGNDSVVFRVDIGDSKRSSGVWVGIWIGVALVILAVVLSFGVLWRKYRITKKKLRDLSQKEVEEFHLGNQEALTGESLNADAQFLPFKSVHEILEQNLIYSPEGILGTGNFGKVSRGKYFGNPVAVKTLLENAGVVKFKEFLSEIKVMSYVGSHPNVVQFIGAVTDKIANRVVYAVMELSPLGDLHSYLRAHKTTFINLLADVLSTDRTHDNIYRPLTTVQLVKWSMDIARGMAYLTQKKVVHGDLASRNILLFHGDVAKITDFGMSRKLYEQKIYVKNSGNHQVFAWRWMSIEALDFLKFSTQSDVVWEMFSLGELPFPGFTWDAEFVVRVENGLRLSRPDYCSEAIYENLLHCWHPDPGSRPAFADIADFYSVQLSEFSNEQQRFLQTI